MVAVNYQHEAQRNRLLRRADWRFLLPDPAPHTCVCYADGELATAAALIADHVVDARHAAPDTCDLAVAVNPSSATLRRAWTALRPGGACYLEWRRPALRGVQHARRQLSTVGFEQIACYWAWPLPFRAAAHCWLPLDSSGALDYFLSSRPQGTTVVHRAGRTARQVVWQLLYRSGLTWPRFTVARKPALHATTPDAAWEMSLRAGWQGWGFGTPPQRLVRLLLTGGQRSINKVVSLVFADDERQPRLAIKQPRVPESVPALVREAATLQAVHGLRPGGIPGVPRVLFYHKQSDTLMLGETVETGVPLWMCLRPSTFRPLALQATAWLADLAGQSAHRPQQDWWGRLVEPVLADFEQMFGSIVDAGMLRETRTRLATLPALPLVVEQRDFSPWNVLLDPRGQLVVLDWESAEVQGLPAMDLIYFATYLAFFLDGAMESKRFRQSYRALRESSSSTGRIADECLNAYMQRLGLAPAVLHPLRLLTWLLHSRSEYRQFVADAGGQPTPAVLRQSLFVQLWEEELRSAYCGIKHSMLKDNE